MIRRRAMDATGCPTRGSQRSSCQLRRVVATSMDEDCFVHVFADGVAAAGGGLFRLNSARRRAEPGARRPAGQPGGIQQRFGGWGESGLLGLVDRDYMPVRPETVAVRPCFTSRAPLPDRYATVAPPDTNVASGGTPGHFHRRRFI